jgi:hypothetical protein
VIGDARLTLRREPDHDYGLLVVDTFSGDTIQIHLLTREALRIDLGPLANDPRWRPPSARPGQAVWTDDFSDPVKLIMWH